MSFINRVKLNEGTHIPSVGLGVYRSPRGEITYQTVLHALQVGYRHIDTAAAYGNEGDVGRAIKESDVEREEIFVTTKLWNADQGYDSTLRAFERSMQRLRLEQLDLYLMHFPVPEKRLESWRAMERLYREERVKAIGVSNFLPHHLEQLLAACTVKPMLNQIEAHPFQTQLPTRQYCQTNNIVVSAYSPLVKAQQMDHPMLCKIAQEHHKTVAQVLIRWSLQSGMVPLPKSNNPQRIIENSQVYDFSLSSQQMQQLNALNQDLYTGWSPVGVP